jgi:polysaccharide export outer membrane protein
MMRTAILSALLAVVPVWLYAGDEPKPNPPADGTVIEQQQTEAPPAVQSPKTTIPGGPQVDAQGKQMMPAGSETDPLKLAAPLSPDGAKGAVAVAGEKSYIIGAEDQLHIVVWNNPPLSGDFIVAPDGRISMGLINEVTASGLTRDELQNEIIRRLKDGGFLRDPTVSVNVTGFNSKKYSIVGEVGHPGSQPLVVPTTVFQALANCGGFKDFANQSKIRIMRGSKQFNFNYKQVIAGKHLEQNIKLEPGDIIIVK